MKKVFLLTTTPTVGGNGDALIAAASAAAELFSRTAFQLKPSHQTLHKL